MQDIGSVWIIGGSTIYSEAIKNDRCKRIFLTNVKKQDPSNPLDCDTFFSKIDESIYQRNEADMQAISQIYQIPTGIQSENGFDFEFQLFERKM